MGLIVTGITVRRAANEGWLALRIHCLSIDGYLCCCERAAFEDFVSVQC